jgi:predicted DNA-binding transcriptional regulator AlpA
MVPAATESDWLKNKQVEVYFGVSGMTIWRWRRDKSLNFPRPALINGVEYTNRAELVAWMKDRVVDRTKQRSKSKKTKAA